jgi:iron-sulfur cluster assembly protein
MAISLTPAAAERVRSFLASRGKGIGLRLGVRKTGCSGFAYVVNYADDSAKTDHVFEDQGVKVFVDPESLPLINGTTVDFVKQASITPTSRGNAVVGNPSQSDRCAFAGFSAS